MKYTRRDFIKTSTAGAAALAQLGVQPPGRAAQKGSARLETFSDWIQADRDVRKRGLEQCLQRIKELEPSIHAWVQVQPERPTGDGPLAEIPFGVKDIVETKGMATEYGSPLYKGRVGTEDGAIIREMRSRGAILLGKTVTTALPTARRSPREIRATWTTRPEAAQVVRLQLWPQAWCPLRSGNRREVR
jgi:hypothetical protein